MSNPTTQDDQRGFLEKLTCLRHAPRELWIIFFAYVLENAAYKLSTGSVLPLWFKDELGMSDVAKGNILIVYGLLATFFTVLVGSITDVIGIRKSFMIGFGVCFFARIAMLFSSPLALPEFFVQQFHLDASTSMMISKSVIPLGLGILPLGLGLAFMTPVMNSAIKRYSNASMRSIAFSFYYALMNLGFAIGDFFFDHFRHENKPGELPGIVDRLAGNVTSVPLKSMGEHGSWIDPILQHSFSTYEVMIFWSVVLTIPGFFLTWLFLRDKVEMTEKGIEMREEPKVTSSESSLMKAAHLFRQLWGQPAFFRFLLFMTLAIGVKMIFFHMSYTMPDYAIRELGKGAPIGSVCNMLNSLLILVFVPICGIVTQNISAYRMVTIGSLVSALSIFILCVPPAWLEPMANGWIGDVIVHKWLGVSGVVNPIYLSIFWFTVILSIGEALWSPRLYEYAAAIAPDGQEASYMSLSVLPTFVSKFFTGGLCGWLLTKYCPENGPRDTATMWAIVGAIALITPVGTFLFRKHIQVKEQGRSI